MQAGDFDKRLVIQAPTRVQDDYGSTVETYGDVDARWAEVTDLSSREFWQAQQVSSDITKKIVLRDRYASLKPTHRFKLGSRVFDIVGIQAEDERNPRQGQTCMCKEVPDG